MPCKRAQAGFTLAEVLAALLFMAIVIPVAVQGLRVASLAGEVAERKTQAARIAERILNENLMVTNVNKSVQTGTYQEGLREFHWIVRSEKWNQDGTAYAPNLVSVEVTFPIQNQDYVVRLNTLVSNQQP